MKLVGIGTILPDGKKVVAITRESVVVEYKREGKKQKEAKAVLSFQDVEKLFV